MIGTRPEAIKLAPVAHALAARGIQPTLVLTGQHPDLDLPDFMLGGYAAMHLCCADELDPHLHVREVAAGLQPMLRSKPDLFIVQGDTSSALGGALAAFTAGVAVAHVEAGLRTHDPSLPWPEEEYRTAIDASADLLFAPTPLAAANLRAARVPGEIHVTGNTGIDALIAIEAKLPACAPAKDGLPRALVTCHRRESWGEGLNSIAAALVKLATCGAARIEMVVHPNPHVAHQMRQLLGGTSGIDLVPLCGHSELVLRVREADLVLSDSGGHSGRSAHARNPTPYPSGQNRAAGSNR